MEEREQRDKFAQAISIFENAFEIAPEERAEFLRDAFAGDLELQRAVEELFLQEHESSSSSVELLAKAIRPVRREMEKALTSVSGGLAPDPPGRKGAAEDANERPRVREPCGAGEERHEEDLSGKLLGGKYRVKRLKGRGGFGNVYEAVDEMLGARVAIKVLNPRAEDSPRAVEHFLREAKLLTAIDHENIVRWITFDRTSDGLHYFVMEYLGGEELEEVLHREGRLAPKRAAKILLSVLSALRTAQCLEAGALLHLDLKPANVFLLPPVGPDDSERVKVIDFGIGQHVGATAREVGEPSEGETSTVFQENPGHSVAATVSEGVLQADGERGITRARGGTLLYASPEQCAHLAGYEDIVRLDGRSDLYSLGIMAFRMLTGQFPFAKFGGAIDAIRNHMEVPPRKVRDLGVRVPRPLAAFVDRCLAKDRDDRFADAGEAYEALTHVLSPPSVWPQVVAGLLMASAALLYGLWPEQRLEPFDVFVASDRVYLGPEQRDVVLPVSNLSPNLVSGAVSFVKNPQTDEPTGIRWRGGVVADVDGHSVSLAAPPDLKASLDTRLYIKVEAEQGVQYSQPINVRFLGPEAFTVEELSFPGLDGQDLDPLGATLEIRVRGQQQDIVSVKVHWQDETRTATLDRSRSEATQPVYVLPLEDFSTLIRTDTRTARFEVELVDCARRRVRYGPLEVNMDPRALAFEELTLSGCFRERPDEYVVYPEDKPVVDFSTNRGAAVEIMALDQDGNELVLTTEHLTPNRIWLGLPVATNAYRGQLLIRAQEGHGILHADPARARAERRLHFAYQTSKPTVVVEPLGLPVQSGAMDRALYYTNRDEVELLLTRRDVQVELAVSCKNSRGEEESELSVELLENTQERVALGLPEDDAYSITIDAFRYSGATLPRPDEPEFSHELWIVRDVSPPRVFLSELPVAPVRDPDSVQWQLRVEGQEGEHAAPVALSWKLLRRGSRVPLAQDLIPAATIDESSGEGALILGDLGIEQLPDGYFEFRVEGQDLAGNATRADNAVCEFELARSGPRLGLEAPLSERWSAFADNQFRVIVRAEDENGVAAVDCTARNRLGKALGPIELDLHESADPRKADWTGAVELPASWSGQSLMLSFHAQDAHGNESLPLVREVQVGAFEIVRTDFVALALKDDPRVDISSMRLVEGDLRYTFGGRSHREERATFQRYGLVYTYRSQVDERRVQDFYLDVNEVTVAQFRAFLEAPLGYRERANWPGADPNEVRRMELMRQLQAMADGLPIANIDWSEACAYACWVGKRLPTLLEWEYAVRGGRAYRPCSMASEGVAFDLAAINVNSEYTEDPGAWTVERGADVTSTGIGSGIRNLCSNVSEWTATEHETGSFYAAGGSFAHYGVFDFSVATIYSSDVLSPRIGFRCALDLEDLDASVEGAPGSRIRFRTTAEERAHGSR